MAPHYNNCSFLAAEVSDHSLSEVGEMMGVSRERIRQIELVAKKKLRQLLAAQGIDEESIHKQSVAQWDCENTPANKTVIREHETDLLFPLNLGNLGVEMWGDKVTPK